MLATELVVVGWLGTADELASLAGALAGHHGWAGWLGSKEKGYS